MLALVYLAAATYFGDRICRRVFGFISIQSRIATAFLVGLLFSTWITFLGSLGFARLHQPLVAGNLIFLLAFALVCYLLPRRTAARFANTRQTRPSGSARWDVVFLSAFLIISCWLMFTTLNFRGGQFEISFKSWTDFGANVSLVQSFALGHNFPPEHPFFPGEPIRYHFLFWFQAANLEFLGLNPVWSINLLSIFSLLALLVLISTSGEILFNSRVVGRIAASLFFFSSSLSYLPFLRTQNSLREAFNAIVNSTDFLASGYPFRGETWGALSANLFAYQRHLISGLGLLFVVMIFLIEHYRSFVDDSRKIAPSNVAPASSAEVATTEDRMADAESVNEIPPPEPRQSSQVSRAKLTPFIVCGVLIGLTPYWNSPIFISALAIAGCAFVLLPDRFYTAVLIATAILVGLPQVLLLRPGHVVGPSLLHWGYTLEHPGMSLVIKYLAWTFGLKWLLIAVAIVFASGFHRRLFLALSSLLIIVFIFQLSTDIFNNHKLLNVWATFANVYAAYALWQMARLKLAGLALAIVLTIAMIFGGVVDLFPLHNDPALTVPYQNDRLTEWLLDNTEPSDIFLSHTLLTHPILFTGRKIYLGYTLFAWTAGYNVSDREQVYRRMFAEQNISELTRLLRANQIAYVAIDDSVRHNPALSALNESIYEVNFQKVFEDTEHHYDNLVIYQVSLP